MWFSVISSSTDDAALRSLMPLLPLGDESAMNFWRNFAGSDKAEVRRIYLLGTGVKIASTAAHFHGFGVA